MTWLKSTSLSLTTHIPVFPPCSLNHNSCGLQIWLPKSIHAPRIGSYDGKHSKFGIFQIRLPQSNGSFEQNLVLLVENLAVFVDFRFGYLIIRSLRIRPSHEELSKFWQIINFYSDCVLQELAVNKSSSVKLMFIGHSGSNCSAFYLWQLVWGLLAILSYAHAHALERYFLCTVKSVPSSTAGLPSRYDVSGCQ